MILSIVFNHHINDMNNNPPSRGGFFSFYQKNIKKEIEFSDEMFYNKKLW